MVVHRPMPPLVLSDDEVQQLQSIANSRSLAYSILQMIRIVMACAAGETNRAISNRMGLTGMTMGKWTRQYQVLGLEDLHDEIRPGLLYANEDDKVAQVINQAPPEQARRRQHPVDKSLHGSC
jgi:putative transposase